MPTRSGPAEVQTLRDGIAQQFLNELSTEEVLFEAVHSLLELLQRDLPQARVFVSGGILRDLAVCRCEDLAFRIHDLDLVAEGVNAQELESALRELTARSARIEGVDRVGKSFAVWKIKTAGNPNPIDLALTRTEWSFGTHHRDFEVSTDGITIEEDSLRRDFRMNALYLALDLHPRTRITGSLLDFHGGLESILDRRIECVGSPRERFQEDPLRMLRAIRFRARLPGFEICPETSAAMLELVPDLLKTVSRERIAEEIYKALTAHPESALEDLKTYGILRHAFPDLERLDGASIQRTGRRLRHLLELRSGAVDRPLLFAAFLFDLALTEAESSLRRHLASVKIPPGRFAAGNVSRIAQGARLHSVKDITQLCGDTLCLIHFDLIENAGAVIEGIFSRHGDPGRLLALYRACRLAEGTAPRDFAAIMSSHRPATIDFNQLLQSSGIPVGPHLQPLKVRLRQLEIEGGIQSEGDARQHLNRLYLEDTHLIQEHAAKVANFVETQPPERPLPTRLREEMRWLLYSRPIRLIKAYHESGLLPRVFPELADAERVFRATPRHFVEGFLNNVYLALSLLCEEVPAPLPVQILATLFRDIGKSWTIQVRQDGTVTYYRHAPVGAAMVSDICRRLGVEESISRAVQFIVREHSNFLNPRDGKGRIRKLLRSVDEGLIGDLLLVLKVDQLSRMRIQGGRRIHEGQLDTYAFIQEHLDEWRAEALEREATRKAVSRVLLSGEDFMADHPAWGPGLPQGPRVGELKGRLMALQRERVVQTREEAIEYAAGRIVLHHLVSRPASYLEALLRWNLLEGILPEIAELVDFDQASPYHTEDAYTHTLNVLRALPGGASRECILAAVFHDIGKPLTCSLDEEKGVYHFYGHERWSGLLFAKICERFGWGPEDFDFNKTAWLIENHMKPKVDWEKTKVPKRTVERLFFRGKDGKGVPKDYREDLMVLRFADNLGAVTEDESIRRSSLDGQRLFEKLVREVEQDLGNRAEKARLDARVKAFWNGSSVLRHFQAEGRAIAELVHGGQDYVRGRLAEGSEEISEEEIRDFLLRAADVPTGAMPSR